MVELKRWDQDLVLESNVLAFNCICLLLWVKYRTSFYLEAVFLFQYFNFILTRFVVVLGLVPWSQVTILARCTLYDLDGVLINNSWILQGLLMNLLLNYDRSPLCLNRRFLHLQLLL